MSSTVSRWNKFYLCALLLSLTSSCLFGQLVQTVNVDIEAENAVLAKEKALAQAEQEAARMLLETVAPSALGLGLAALQDLGSKCSAGFEIADEKFSSARYLARIHQQLNKKCIVSELKKVGITPTFSTETTVKVKARPLLLVGQRTDPTSGDVSLWDESQELPHTIYETFSKLQGVHAFPLHDLNDHVLLPSISLENLSFSAFEKIAKHYHAENIHLVVAQPQASGTLVSAYKITPFKTLSCSAQMIERSADLTPESYAQTIATHAVSALEHCTPAPAAPSTKPAKQEATSGQPLESRIVTLKFENFDQYLHLKRALSTLSSVHTLHVKELSATYASIHVDLSTTLDPFKQESEEMGLKVIENSDQTIEVSALR